MVLIDRIKESGYNHPMGAVGGAAKTLAASLLLVPHPSHNFYKTR